MIAEIAVPVPLHGTFHYRWPEGVIFKPGLRVKVGFGRRQLIGVTLTDSATTTVPDNKLKTIAEVIDAEPVLPVSVLTMLRWLSDYYHYPLGEVLNLALPVALRRGAPAVLEPQTRWVKGADNNLPDEVLTWLARAPLRKKIHSEIGLSTDGLDAAQLRLSSPRWRQAVEALEEKGLVRREFHSRIGLNSGIDPGPTLHPEQAEAVDAIQAARNTFQAFLLFGVTGSGKTEVYLRAIDEAVSRRRQVLVLVPEIALTPQLLGRFRQRLTARLVVLHSAMNESERLEGWLAAAEGQADVVIGTRSAALLPLPRLGLIVVDEEHDNSYKQQDGLRYHARDLALVRARENKCPVVLGSATPSLESLYNVKRGRYIELSLTHRAGGASAPAIALLDIRRRPLIEGLSDRLLEAIRRALDEGGQAMVFINRRGFAPTLICNDCGQPADCQRCDAHMTVHAAQSRLRCHHCGSERPIPECCEHCGSLALDRVGYGTERIANAIEEAFPDVAVARIDRDSTRRKGELDRQLARAQSGEARILVGTQMLAKGHHFPSLTLVGILDADRGLFGTDFRALEHMAQLVLQVAGRAGRAERPGQVLLQTRNPEHPLLNLLVAEGYRSLADALLEDRRASEMPPCCHLVVIRAEASSAAAAALFLSAVRDRLYGIDAELSGGNSVSAEDTCLVLGPAAAPMERLGGRYRAQLLLQAPHRALLHQRLSRLIVGIDDLKGSRKARWSIDVDPVDLY